MRTGAPVRRIEVAGGRARGVRLEDGTRLAADAVLADVAAPLLYEQLLEPGDLPPRLLRDLRKFQWDSPTMKIDWALSAPIPWTAEGARGAGSVELICGAGLKPRRPRSSAAPLFEETPARQRA